MRKKTGLRMLGAFVALACLVALLPAIPAQAASAGDGTKANPYIIANAAEFKQFAADVNGGQDFSGAYFKLNADIKLSGVWTPIGSYEKPFKGNFDGNSKMISGLNVNAAYDAAGLFGYIEGASISNLTVKGKVTSSLKDNSVGGLVGWAHKESLLTGCKSYVTTIGNGSDAVVGSLAGVLYDSDASKCAAYGKTSSSGFNASVGGAFGAIINGNALDCAASGAVSANGELCVAGGFTAAVITRSSGRAFVVSGILVEENSSRARSTITNCNATGNVSGGKKGSAAGGLLGLSRTVAAKDSVTVDKCTAKGNITSGSGDCFMASICSAFLIEESGGKITVSNCKALCASLKNGNQDPSRSGRVAGASLGNTDGVLLVANEANPKMKINGKVITEADEGYGEDSRHGANIK